MSGISFSTLLSTVPHFLFNYNSAQSSSTNPIAHFLCKVNIPKHWGEWGLWLRFSHSKVSILCFYCPHKVILTSVTLCFLTDQSFQLTRIFLSLLFPWPSLLHLGQPRFYSQHFLLDGEFYHGRDIWLLVCNMMKPRHHQTWLHCGLALTQDETSYETALSFGRTFPTSPRVPVGICGWLGEFRSSLASLQGQLHTRLSCSVASHIHTYYSQTEWDTL